MIKRHLLFFLVLAVATFIRFHDISRQMIFIGDQGRDFLVARELVTEGKVPLLGIPSSVPRFKQGPLYIYFLALIYWISQGSVLATGLLAAGFGVASVVAVYVLAITYLDRSRALLASFLVAFSPMMILHSRMPYHVNPIPFFVVIYLWQVIRLYERKRWASFGAGLGFALVFQFELAAFPLLLLIPLALVLRNTSRFTLFPLNLERKSIRAGVETVAGIGFGLLPQIIFDLTHGFTQIGGFLVWMLYKIVTAVVPFTRNSLVDHSTPVKLKEILLLFTSVFTQNQIVVDQFFWIALSLLSVVFVLVVWKKQPGSIQVITAACVLLSTGLVFHRVPSEAYMPLFVIPVSLAIAHFVSSFVLKFKIPLMAIISFSFFLSLVTLTGHHYFLLSPFESDWNTYRFGPSIATQKTIVQVLFALSSNQCVQLASKERDETFRTLYNHLEYLIALDPRSEVGKGECIPFLIDRPEYAKQHWESAFVQDHLDVGPYWIAAVKPKKVYAKR